MGENETFFPCHLLTTWCVSMTDNNNDIFLVCVFWE